MTQTGVVYRYVPPAQQLEIFGGKRAAQRGFALGTGVGISGKKHHADRVIAGRGQLETQRGAFGAQETIGDL